MDERCDAFENFRRKREGECIDSDFEEHLVSCPECRDQRAAEEALGNLFSKTIPSGLSPSFNVKLRRRIREESGIRSRRPILMQAYWLIACLISVIIILTRSGENMENGVAVMLLLFCFAVPTLLLGKMLRFNLFDLILSTMNHPEKR